MIGRSEVDVLVLVAVERAEGWDVAACAGDGRVVWRRTFQPGAWQELLEDWLGAAEPAWPAAVALLVARAGSDEYPVTETLLPCPVVSLPRRAALAAFAPPDWRRFAIVNEGETCGLVTRSEADRFYYAEGAASAGAARDFGFEHVVDGADADGRVWSGAARIAIAALSADGVCAINSNGRPALRLSRRRSAAYDVIHNDGATFAPEDDCLARIIDGRPALFAVDGNVLRLYGRALHRYAKARLDRCVFATVRPGDGAKSWSQVAYLCEQAQRAGLPRRGVIAAVGGGVTLDLAGLAAALYRRGVPYLRIPTTLLGMVDVAVGIKQAINFQGKKSLLGSFYPPIAAINDSAFLRTLPPAEIANGFAEILKVGLVRDGRLFDWVEQHGPALARSCCQDPPGWAARIAMRAEYVMMADLQPNLYESDLRRFPDFGHTFSPAIEEAAGYAASHGAAVAADMLLATLIAVRRGVCEQRVLERLTAVYRALGLLSLPETCSAEVLLGAFKSARLHRGGQVHLVVPSRMGEGCFLEDVTAEEVCEALGRAVTICAIARGGVYAGAGY